MNLALCLSLCLAAKLSKRNSFFEELSSFYYNDEIHLPFAANCRPVRHVPRASVCTIGNSHYYRMRIYLYNLLPVPFFSSLLFSFLFSLSSTRSHEASPRDEDTSRRHRQGRRQQGLQRAGLRRGSQSINGRVLLIELPTNSVFMRLRRRVHCGARGAVAWAAGAWKGGGVPSLAIGSLCKLRCRAGRNCF